MGDERAHPEFGGQGQGGAVVGFGRRHVAMVVRRSYLAEKAKSPGFGAAVTVFTGKRHAASCRRERIRRSARQQVRLAEVDEQRRPPLDRRHGLHTRQSLLEQWKALSDTTG